VPKALFDRLDVKEHELVQVRFFHNKKLVNTVVAPYEHTFGGVAKGKPLVYLNSLLDVAVALNQGSYAAKNKIESGVDWEVEISRAKK
jgi:S-adenosylmethionine hydrolase